MLMAAALLIEAVERFDAETKIVEQAPVAVEA
jgi:hypothetical protein